MNEQQEKSLQDRVAQLEAAVVELQKILQEKNAAVAAQTKPALSAAAAVKPAASAPPINLNLGTPRSKKPGKAFDLPDNMRTNEYWLNKIGIGLLLFGVAFLFKYSIDQGWLTPSIRVAFGVGLGATLIVLGSFVYSKRRHFSQVLIGGGIATFYITGFAAFQILALVSHPVAFAFMVSVTVLAFILSLQQNGAVLSLIGAIGGFGTPFLLYTGAGNLPGLIGYTCLLLTGTSAIYFYRGWRSLVLTSFFGAWVVFAIALLDDFSSTASEADAERWAVQSGLVFAWLAFWTLPVIREILAEKNPARWLPPSVEDDKQTREKARSNSTTLVHMLSVSTPLIAFFMSMGVWTLSDKKWGWMAMGVAAIYSLASFVVLRLSTNKNLSFAHGLVGAIFVTIALSLLLEGDTLRFALATEAAVLHLIAIRVSFKGAAISAHLLFAGLALWMIPRLFFGAAKGPAIINAQSLADLWTIAAGFAISLRFSFSDEKRIYRFLIHVAVLGWLLRELSTFSHGQGYVTIAWGIYAVTLLVAGLRMNSIQLRNVAMGTLLVVVGKLFLVDLAELETIWRVLLFLGFGGLFLFLSYYFQALWKSTPGPSDSKP